LYNENWRCSRTGGQRTVYELPNQWLVRFTKAMEEELIELKTDLR